MTPPCSNWCRSRVCPSGSCGLRRSFSPWWRARSGPIPRCAASILQIALRSVRKKTCGRARLRLPASTTSAWCQNVRRKAARRRPRCATSRPTSARAAPPTQTAPTSMIRESATPSPADASSASSPRTVARRFRSATGERAVCASSTPNARRVHAAMTEHACPMDRSRMSTHLATTAVSARRQRRAAHCREPSREPPQRGITSSWH